MTQSADLGYGDIRSKGSRIASSCLPQLYIVIDGSVARFVEVGRYSVMVSSEVNAALAWLHILAAVGWMGTAMFMVMVLVPSTADLQPSSRKDLLTKLLPRFSRYVTAFATLTLVAGILLAFAHVGDRLDSLSPTNPWGLSVTVGATLSLVAYVLALGVGLRSARKIVSILQKVGPDPQQSPPTEVASLQRRMRLTATTVMILLMLSLVFMVAAARLAEPLMG